MRRRSRRLSADSGASAIEYTGLIVLAALIAGTLVAVVPGPVRTKTAAALCALLRTAHCPARTDDGPRDDCEAFCPTPENPIHPSDPVTAATKGNYAGLGDSYASGEGANGDGDYLPGSNTETDRCHRSPHAFSPGLQKEFTFQGGDPRFVACSNARTIDIVRGMNGEPPQLDALNARTTTVTLSIGGNDVDFAGVMRKCVTDLHFSLKFWDPPKEDQCHAQAGKIAADMNTLFGHPPDPSRYQRMLERIHERAPNARILVSGYPHLFPEPPEDDYLTVNQSDQAFLNAKGRELNAAIQRQVQELDAKWYGGTKKMGSFEYVDNWDAMKGHEIGTDDPWLNGLQICKGGLDKNNPNCKGNWAAGTGTFHPGPDGQRAFQRSYARQLREGPGRVLWDP